MKTGKAFLVVFGVLAILVLGFVAGEMIRNLNRLQPNNAADISIAFTPIDFFSQEFSSSADIVPVNDLAAGGLGDALLKSNVWNSLLEYERKANCAKVTSNAISVAQINEAGEFWVENWTVNACGKTEVFKIKFTPDPIGGTIYSFVP